jgi:hypothetical protein
LAATSSFTRPVNPPIFAIRLFRSAVEKNGAVDSGDERPFGELSRVGPIFTRRSVAQSDQLVRVGSPLNGRYSSLHRWAGHHVLQQLTHVCKKSPTCATTHPRVQEQPMAKNTWSPTTRAGPNGCKKSADGTLCFVARLDSPFPCEPGR